MCGFLGVRTTACVLGTLAISALVFLCVFPYSERVLAPSWGLRPSPGLVHATCTKRAWLCAPVCRPVWGTCAQCARGTCARLAKSAPRARAGFRDAAVVGGGPARGGGHRDWPAPAPCARRRGRGAGAAGGPRYEKGGARGGGGSSAAAALESAARSPVQPWPSPRRAPAPPSASATRSPARRPEPDPRPRRCLDRDPGRPAMTATAALLPVLSLLLAFGHSAHGERPAARLAPPLGKPATPLWPPGDRRAPSHAPQLPPVPPNPKPRSLFASPSPPPLHAKPGPGSPRGQERCGVPSPFPPRRSGAPRGVGAPRQEVWRKEVMLGVLCENALGCNFRVLLCARWGTGLWG